MALLTIYYDFTDPWSYIAVFRVDWLRAQVPSLEVRWWPFEIYPDLPPRGARPQNAAFLRRKTQYDVDETTRELGITMRVPYDRVYNSRLALEGGLYARDAGQFDRYQRAVFAAFFEHGRNISKLDELVAVAGESELDADALRAALEEHRYADEVIRLRAEAEDFGVVATPTFVANNQGAVGIVAKDKLLRLVTSE